MEQFHWLELMSKVTLTSAHETASLKFQGTFSLKGSCALDCYNHIGFIYLRSTRTIEGYFSTFAVFLSCKCLRSLSLKF